MGLTCIQQSVLGSHPVSVPGVQRDRGRMMKSSKDRGLGYPLWVLYSVRSVQNYDVPAWVRASSPVLAREGVLVWVLVWAQELVPVQVPWTVLHIEKH